MSIYLFTHPLYPSIVSIHCIYSFIHSFVYLSIHTSSVPIHPYIVSIYSSIIYIIHSMYPYAISILSIHCKYQLYPSITSIVSIYLFSYIYLPIHYSNPHIHLDYVGGLCGYICCVIGGYMGVCVVCV